MGQGQFGPHSVVTNAGQVEWRKTDVKGADIVSRVFDLSKYGRGLADHPNLRSDGKFIVWDGTPLSLNAGGAFDGLVFPTKRTTLYDTLGVAATSIPVTDGRPFNVGDEITVENGAGAAATSQTITAIVFNGTGWQADIEVDVTIGVAKVAGDEVWTPDHDLPVGILMDPVDLTDTAEDAVIRVLTANGAVFEETINLISIYTDEMKAVLQGGQSIIADASGDLLTHPGKNIRFHERMTAPTFADENPPV